MKIERINNIQLNQSSGFFKLKPPKKRLCNLRSILISAASPRSNHPNYYIYAYRVPFVSDGRTLYYSLCVFKYSAVSSLFINEVKGFEEIHVGYLIIVEYGDYIAVSKKGTGDLSDLMDQLNVINPDTLCNSFVNDSTNIERLAMRNLDASDSAIRTKIVEGLDLRKSFSGYGANRQFLRSVRISSSNQRKSVTTATSFITETGRKVSIENYVSWVKTTIDELEGFVPHGSFLDIFAKSIDYTEYKEQLTPASILFYQDKILEDLNSGQISEFFFRGKKDYTIDINERLRSFERCLNIKTDGSFHIENRIDSSLRIVIGAASYYLTSSKLFRQVFVRFSTGREIRLLTYLNEHKCYSIFFKERDCVYSNGRLFRDSQLLGNIPQFLEVFKVVTDLELVYKEKGDIKKNPNAFEDQTVFRCTEDHLCNSRNFTFGLLDDLHSEWADHIGIGENKVAFFVEKCVTSEGSSKLKPKSPHYSASAFQEVVAQAEKNLGLLHPLDHLLDNKIEFWKRNYNNDGVKTNIPRLVFGTSVEAAVDKWKEIKRSPFHQTEMNLVVNFISKNELKTKLAHLKDGDHGMSYLNEVIQIMWLVSSLINCARELGTQVNVYCKP